MNQDIIYSKEGTFGSRMYNGFQYEEVISLEVMPLFPLLQGFVSRFLGVGVLQMRLLPAVFGAATLYLTYSVAASLSSFGKNLGDRGNITGLGAVALLLFWQWTPPGANFLASGIPMIDISRIARYDNLIPALGLAAFWCWIRARQSRELRYHFLGGILASLAMLSNVYGAFWIILLGLLTWVDNRMADTGSPARGVLAFLLGVALPVLSFLVVITTHWTEFTAQMVKHSGRFDLLGPGFYARNIRNEIHRYHLGLRSASSYLRLGLWLFLIGLPVSFAWHIRQIREQRHRPPPG